MNASLVELLQIAQRSYTRIPVILSGQKQWCFDQISEFTNEPGLKKSTFENSLLISQEPENLPCDIPHISADKVIKFLGSEVNMIIWDGFSGLNPSALGAATGLIRGGGLFILCIPDLSNLAQKPDPDYRKLCSFEDDLKRVNTYFLQGMRSLCFESPCALLQQCKFPIAKTNSKLELIKPTEINALHDHSALTLPTHDQLQAMNAIRKVSQGHRNRPLVISADRGRGKTSSLGLAAAQLTEEFGHKIVVTAPRKNAVAPLFEHFIANSSDTTQAPIFYSPDELIESLVECHLLLIDEAAAIPTSLLKQLVQRYKRIVLSTTIHGYEGNGRGFEIRFKNYLDEQCPGWHSIHLSQAIRWAENDPLEHWTDKLLHLRPKDYVLPQQEQSLHVSFRWVSQEELFNKQALLEQVVSLLVNAHYQTSPDDIRLLLDHPDVHIGIQELSTGIQEGPMRNQAKSQGIAGVIMLIKEGEIIDDELRNHILAGKRRLRGHITPQTLATSTGVKELLSLSYLRVIRIAVAKKCENNGYGSEMLQEARKYCLEKKIDFLSTSFGLSKNLIHFWQKNGFHFTKLGTHKDSSTGAYSATLCSSVSQASDAFLNTVTNSFAEELLFGLSRQYRLHDSDTLALILNLTCNQTQQLTHLQITNIEHYSEQFRNLHDSAKDISALILYQCSKNTFLKALRLDQAAILVAAVLQGRSTKSCVKLFSLDGKKELNQKLRQCTSLLLS